MERNKKIIVIVAFIICLSILGGYIYIAFFNEMDQDKKSKIEFELPKFSDKKTDSVSKLHYYDEQIDKENIARSFLLEKEDSLKKIIGSNNHEKFYDQKDFQKDLTDSDSRNNNDEDVFSDNNNKKSQSQENLSRLLNVMEQNSNYLNKIEKNPTASNSKKLQHINRNGSTKNKDIALQSYYDIPESIVENEIKNDDIENYFPENRKKINAGKNINFDKSEDISESDNREVVYRKVPKDENLDDDVAFLGVTKNKNAFNGVISDSKLSKKELVRAEIYTTQTIGSGGLVMINLLEDLVFEKEDIIIPKSTVLYGMTKFAPGRMFISISPNVSKNNKRLPNEVIVFDFDGLEGVFIETNLIGSIPVETANELTEIVKESYKNANPLTGNSKAVPLKEASIIIGSEKILKYLNRLKLKIIGGYKIWVSVKKEK